MASAAFKSTTRRGLHATSTSSSSSRSDPPPCPRRARSRSVSAAPRGRASSAAAHEDHYANTRTNPLFDASASSPSASPPPPPPPGQGAAAGCGAASASSARGHAAAGRDEPRLKGGGGGRARSASVAPPQRRRHTPSAAAAAEDSAGEVRGRRASRARSVAADDAHARTCTYRGAETDAETRDVARKLQPWRRHSVPEGKHRGTDASSSQESTTRAGCRQTDESSHSEYSTVVSSPCRLDHNHSTVPVDPVLEIPPEFDPDCPEFISDISDYVTEYGKKDALEIPIDFDTDAAELVSEYRNTATKQHWDQMEISLESDTDASELVSDIWHHGANQQRGQLEAPLEFDPDTSELAPDITEYTFKLKQSHERARKLRADLAVEEQREQELSRMLKGIVTVPNFTETHKKRPRRKSSIERLKVSRHLAEEAMNYFEECVSISTMDSTEFSSPEDPQPNSVVNVPPKSNSRFVHKGRSIFQEPHTPADQTVHQEESDKQTQCSISATGSDVSDSVTFSHTNGAGLKIRSISCDDPDGFDSPRSRSSCFSFNHEPVKLVENCDVRQYLGSFGRGNSRELKEIRPSYFADDYALQKVNPDLLKDRVTFQNQIEYGGLVICNIRTF